VHKNKDPKRKNDFEPSKEIKGNGKKSNQRGRKKMRVGSLLPSRKIGVNQTIEKHNQKGKYRKARNRQRLTEGP